MVGLFLERSESAAPGAALRGCHPAPVPRRGIPVLPVVVRDWTPFFNWCDLDGLARELRYSFGIKG